jgi:hypothetical protein
MDVRSSPNHNGNATMLHAIYSSFKSRFSALQNSDRREPSRFDLTLLWLLAGAIFVAVVLRFQDYVSIVDHYGDNMFYLKAASAIRHWNLHKLEIMQFLGISYLTACLSLLSGLSERTSLLLISTIASLLSILLAKKLWDGWIAGFFAILNFTWLQRALLGGSESLFVVLLFSAFWALRRKRWIVAVLLASIATVTRPVGFLLLVSIGIVLLAKREYKKLLLSVGSALVIGMMYVLPFWIYFQDPLYQWHRYKTADWDSGWLIHLPFYTIATKMLYSELAWRFLGLTLGWMLFVAIGALLMTRERYRQYFREHQPECLFGLLYIALLFTYNSSRWAINEFVRFAIPALPFVLVSLRDWIPKSRIVLYGLGMLFAFIAASWIVHMRNVFPMLFHP